MLRMLQHALEGSLPKELSTVVEMGVEFPKAEVLRLLGNGADERCVKRTERKIAKWSEKLTASVKPKLVYSVEKLAGTGKSSVSLQNGITIRSAKIGKAFKECSAVFCFAATLGEPLDQVVEELAGKGKVSDASIVDAMGSAATEHIIEQFHRDAEANCRAGGMGVTLRFSPGYCDWAITEQEKLFSLLDVDRIGLELTDSSLMTPRKSVSGVFGLTKKRTAALLPYNPCSRCNKTDCRARRTTRI